MSWGNKIVVTADARGQFVEGIIGAGLTPKPGTVMQIDFSVAKVGNRWTWKLFNPGTNGNRPKGPLIVLREDMQQGRTMTTAYAAGDRAFGYVPLAGDELNMLLKDVSGTADVRTAGDMYMVEDTSGKLIVTTGSPQSTPFVLAETLSALTADALAHCVFSGF